MYGLEELFSPNDAKVDMVFVHGLHGDREKTWTKNGVLWPRDLLSTDLPNSRILTFGYDSNVTHMNPSEITQGRMGSHAADLCAKLANLRRRTETTERPIIFVAHSLGGLICADALVMGDRKASGDNAQHIAKYTRGVVFLGTPFRGSSVADWAERLRRIVNVFYDTNAASFTDLRLKSETLRGLGEAFPDVLRKRLESSKERIEVAFFNEQLKTRSIMVVDEFSAWIPGFGEKASIRADHSNICKFDNKDDEGYRLVMSSIKKMIDSAMKTETLTGSVNFNNNNSKIVNQAYTQTISSQQIQL